MTLLRSHTLTAILYSAILGIGILGSLTAVLGYCHLLTLQFILPLAAASFASGVLYLLATIRGADHPIRMVADLRFMRRHIRHKRRSQSIRAVRRRVVPSDRWSWLHYSLFAVTAMGGLPTAQNAYLAAFRAGAGNELARGTVVATTIFVTPTLLLIAALLG